MRQLEIKVFESYVKNNFLNVCVCLWVPVQQSLSFYLIYFVIRKYICETPTVSIHKLSLTIATCALWNAISCNKMFKIVSKTSTYLLFYKKILQIRTLVSASKGPDRILHAEKYTTTDPNVPVKLWQNRLLSNINKVTI